MGSSVGSVVLTIEDLEFDSKFEQFCSPHFAGVFGRDTKYHWLHLVFMPGKVKDPTQDSLALEKARL